MKLATLARLGAKHVRNAVAEAAYLRTRLDITRPTAVHAILTLRCNSRCRYCGYWREDGHLDEMNGEEWRTALLSLKAFLGHYHVEFTGGEPLLKEGVTDLLHFCHQNGIRFGVTTNGSMFSERMAEQVIAARPLNINISLDSHIAEIHDTVRGVPGSHARVTQGIRRLLTECEKQRADVSIVLKPTVHALNFDTLPEMVQWVQDMGAGGSVNLQPVGRWTPETDRELWIGGKDLDKLEDLVQRLVELRRNGAPILNSEASLRLLPRHFREEKAPPEALPCRVGMRNFFIRPDGDVTVCWFFPPIGNLKRNSAREVWRSAEARERRRQTTKCTRLCLFTCLSQKTLMDKVRMGLRLLAGSRRRAATAASDQGTTRGRASPQERTSIHRFHRFHR